MASEKIYEMVTDRIIAALDKGTVPWRKPWKASGRDATAPMNIVSNKSYRGINIFVLISAGYTSRYWLTFNQARAHGGSVRKGERGSPVVFWTFIEKMVDDGNGGKRKESIPFLRYYTVFNIEQTENVKVPAGRVEVQDGAAEADDVAKIDAAEAVAGVYLTRESIRVGAADYAAYAPLTDTILMPNRETFASSEGYYSTLFHEMVHSTGADKRLARIKRVQFGSGEYSREELVAEFGASMLAGATGITRDVEIENSAAYIAHWKSFIASDPRALVVAAGAAQKAADFILADGKDEAEEENE